MLLTQKRGLLTAASAITVLLLTACGGGSDSPAPGPSATAPAPGSTPSPGSGPAPGGTPTPGAAPTPGSTPAPSPGTGPTEGSVPSLASLAAGAATGGVTDRTTSGYSADLLQGRWDTMRGLTIPGSEPGCFSLPATPSCSIAISLRFGEGYVASGLQATRIMEAEYFNGANCVAGNLIGKIRFARDITFEPGDTLIPDISDTGPGDTAVRRGQVTAERYDVSEMANASTFFEQCQSEDPTTPDETEVSCAPASVALRLESNDGPRLLLDENEPCQSGSVAPPAAAVAQWTIDREDGLVKLP